MRIIDDTAMFDLLAAIYQRTLLDARQGDRGAIRWLDVVRPDWRKLERRHGTACDNRAAHGTCTGCGQLLPVPRNPRLMYCSVDCRTNFYWRREKQKKRIF